MNPLQQLNDGHFAGATRLALACGLTEFPRAIFDLADTLEILDLSGNRLSRLPDDLPRLRKLRILFCSNNAFTELPAVLGDCPQLEMVGFKSNRIARLPSAALPARLRWLILTDNALTALPDSIGRCADLQKLMLAGNRLTELPASLVDCRRLELLRIAANRLTGFPHHLLALPRLAWLAFAGNPFAADAEAAAQHANPGAPVDWDDLELLAQLGEGASGVIHRARRRHQPDTPELAIKLFKGTVTSDGYPHSELTACLAAGEHPNRIPVLGRVAGHPAGTDGLLMPLVAADFRTLAAPPSLASCTRDVYPADSKHAATDVLRIAHGIAALAAHLHRRGIMHGDLYAHNILHAPGGRALLGDFGAASIYPADTSPHAARLERIEVRAFGCLLEELVDRCAGPPTQQPPATADHTRLTANLRGLAEECLQPAIDARPNFRAVEAHLGEAFSAA